MRALIVLAALLAGGCVHRAPETRPTAPAEYTVPGIAKPDDRLCVQASPFDPLVGPAEAMDTAACTSVGEIRRFIRTHRYADP